MKYIYLKKMAMKDKTHTTPGTCNWLREATESLDV